MLRIRKRKSVRFFSGLLIFAFIYTAVATELMPVRMARAAGSTGTFRVAVLTAASSVKSDVIDFSATALKFVRQAFAENKNFDIIDPAKFSGLVEGKTITDDAAFEIGKSIKADLVVLVGISNYSLLKDPDEALVDIEIKILDIANQQIWARSLTRGSSGPKPGYDGLEKYLAGEAVYDAAFESVAESVRSSALEGVITTVLDNEFRISLSTRDGIANGTVMQVIQDGQVIAKMEITEASIALSAAKVTSRMPGKLVKTGDKVRVEYIPSGTFTEKSVKRAGTVPKEKKGFSPVLTALLGIGLVATLIGLGGKKDKHDPTVIVGTFCEGPACVYIPKEVASSQQPTVKVAANPPSTVVNQYVRQVSAVYDYGPEGYQFPGSVIISISYGSADANGCVLNPVTTSPDGCTQVTYLRIYTYNKSTRKWEPTNSTVDPQNKVVKLSVNHFSYYVIMEDEQPDAPLPPSNLTISTCGTQGGVVLNWDASVSTTTVGYYVYSCTAEGTCDTETAANVTGTTYTASGLTNGSTVYFAVVAYDELGQISALSQIVDGVVGFCPAPVRLILPPNGSRVETTTPPLVWEGPTENNRGYVLEVSHYAADQTKTIVWYVAGLSPTVAEGTTEGTETPGTELLSEPYAGSPLQYNNTYYWRVCALNSAQGCSSGSSAWTTPFAFTVASADVGPIPGEQCNLDPPVLIYPSNGAKILSTSVTLIWSKVSGAEGYLVKVVDQSGVDIETITVGSVAVEGQQGTSAPATKTPLNIAAYTDMSQYSWSVATAATNCYSIWSDPFFFTKWPSDPHETTTLQPPTWATVPLRGYDKLVVLYWEPNQEPELAGYNVYRSTTQTGPYGDPIIKIPISQLSAPSTNVNCPQGSAAQPIYCDEGVTNGSKYYYKLEAFDNGNVNSAANAPMSIELALQRPTLISPGSSNCTTPITETAATQVFYWTKADGDGTVKYYLEVYDDTEKTMLKVSQPTSTNDTATGFIDQHKYMWRVKTLNDTTSSSFSGYFCFKKETSSMVPDTPTFISASVNTNMEITIQWTKNTEANVVKYLLFRRSSGASTSQQITDISQPATGTSVTYKDVGLPRGTVYYYRVQAVDSANNKSELSDEYEVTLNFGIPTLLSPPNRSMVTDTAPEFAWVAESGATSYLIQVAKNSNFKAESRIWETVTTATNIAFGDGASPTETLANGEVYMETTQTNTKEYFWRVASFNDDFPPNPSGFSRFYKILGLPSLIAPSNGESTANDTPTFIWSSVPGAVNYIIRVCRREEDQPPENAGKKCSQEFLWESVTNATQIIYAGPSLLNCQNATCSTGGEYAWQVLAMDANNQMNYGEWLGSDFLPTPTPYYLFRKATYEPPVKVSPKNFAIVYPDPQTYEYQITFEWISSPQISDYQIRLYEDIYDPVGLKIVTGNLIWSDTGSSGISFPGKDITLQAGRIYGWNIAGHTAQGWVEFNDSRENYFITGFSYPALTQPENNSYIPRVTINTFSGIQMRFEWEARESVGTPAPTPHFANAYDYQVELIMGSGGSNPYVTCDPDGAASNEQLPLSVLDNDGAEFNTNTIEVSANFFICAHAEVSAGERIYWRVRARDHNPLAALFNPDGTIGANAGLHNPGAWSVYGLVIVGVSPVTLSLPPNSRCEDYTDLVTCDQSGLLRYITCQDQPFYWSPVTAAAGSVNLFWQISDDPSFNNLADFAILNGAAGSYVWLPSPGAIPVIGVYNSAKSPLVDGTIYYWRVGTCEWTNCEMGAGDPDWVFSRSFAFLKRPPIPSNFSATTTLNDEDICEITLNWEPGYDCQGNQCAVTNDCSLPYSPPNGGGYTLYFGSTADPTTQHVTFSATANTTMQTDSCGGGKDFTLQTYDASGSIDYIGSTSPAITLSVGCPPCPAETGSTP